MPRTTLDFHENRTDAIAALVSLREVGLKAEDVGSIWAKPSDADALASLEKASIELVEVSLADSRIIHLSGWLAEGATEFLNFRNPSDIAAMLARVELDISHADQVRKTITSGGGVVAIRARDAHLQSDER